MSQCYRDFFHYRTPLASQEIGTVIGVVVPHDLLFTGCCGQRFFQDQQFALCNIPDLFGALT
ncbi:MAG: hypothetical protein AB1545_13815 [Thermodesulfobacteriota bacterium]|jgi:hypothetical protein